MRVDFTKYLFRCHSLGLLMTGADVGLTEAQEKRFAELHQRNIGLGKPLTENMKVEYAELMIKMNSKGGLSKGAKTYLKKLHQGVCFKREDKISSKYLDKGIIVEEQSFSLVSEYFGRFYKKNTERRENDFLTGEPDNTQNKTILDIKSSWELDTFPMYDEVLPDKKYDDQVHGYMDLWEYDSAKICYCLVDTPFKLIDDEIRRMDWKYSIFDGQGSVIQEMIPLVVEKVKNHVFSAEKLEAYCKHHGSIDINWFSDFIEIPKEFRVRVFDITRSDKKIQAIHDQVLLAREYLNDLSVNLSNRVV